MVFGQAPANPGIQTQPGYRIYMKTGPAAKAPPPERESGDCVAVDADGTIVCSSSGKSFSVPGTNRMSPDITVSYALANGRIKYVGRIANAVDPNAVDP